MNASNSCEREHALQQLHPFFTTWHITFGTHGARLHGGPRATVDRQHNQRGEAFIDRNEDREEAELRRMNSPAAPLTIEQCMFIEAKIPSICERGGRILRTCAAPAPRQTGTGTCRLALDGDHVHVLLDAPRDAEPKVIRELLKRWLTQAMNERFSTSEPARPRAGKAPKEKSKQWWAEGGSTKPVKDIEYLRNAHGYIERQRATR